MSLRLLKLQKSNLKTKKLRKNLPEDWKNIESVFYHQGLMYILEIICLKIICCHHNNLLVSYFEINKLENLLPESTFDLLFIKILKLISNAVMFAWL